MKTKVTTIGRITRLAVAIAVFTIAATAVNAQEKGATKLLQLNTSKAAPPAAVPDYKPMSCAKCNDSFITVPDTDPKGAGARLLVTGNAPTRIVAKHLCDNCTNEWIVKGHGKAATSVPVHKCASCI